MGFSNVTYSLCLIVYIPTPLKGGCTSHYWKADKGSKGDQADVSEGFGIRS